MSRKIRENNKKKHSEAIKRKYHMEHKYIYVLHSTDWQLKMRLVNRSMLSSISLYISSEDYGTTFNKIKAPHTLAKYIKEVKSGSMNICDLDTKTTYDSLEDYMRHQIILKLAGIDPE